MLVSEIKGWHWAITWDNASPADSSSMLAALGALGNLTEVQTKTTCLLAPKSGVTWRKIRSAIEVNLHPKKGNALYVNLRSGKVFQRGKRTGHKWKKVV